MSDTQTMRVTEAIQKLNADTKSLIEHNFKTFEANGGFGEAAIKSGDANDTTTIVDNNNEKNAKIVVLYESNEAIAPKTKANAVMTDDGLNMEETVSEIKEDLAIVWEELFGEGTIKKLDEVLGV